MTLTSEQRGALERIIDETVKHSGEILKAVRNPNLDLHQAIQNDDDYTVGFAHGFIIAAFSQRIRNDPDFMDKLLESLDILYRRTPEIKKAIFDQG